MKKLLAMVALTATVGLAACGPGAPGEYGPKERMAKEERIMESAENISYFRDPRTSLCFARFYGDYNSMTYVPCENIPPELLWGANK